MFAEFDELDQLAELLDAQHEAEQALRAARYAVAPVRERVRTRALRENARSGASKWAHGRVCVVLLRPPVRWEADREGTLEYLREVAPELIRVEAWVEDSERLAAAVERVTAALTLDEDAYARVAAEAFAEVLDVVGLSEEPVMGCWEELLDRARVTLDREGRVVDVASGVVLDWVELVTPEPTQIRVSLAR